MVNQTLENLTLLRLGTMVKEYRRQSELPAMSELTFDERLAMLVDAEWLERKNRKLARLIRLYEKTKSKPKSQQISQKR